MPFLGDIYPECTKVGVLEADWVWVRRGSLAGGDAGRGVGVRGTLSGVELSKYRPVGNLERVDTLTRNSQKSWF